MACTVDNAADALFITDIARINSQAVNAIFSDFKGNTIVKVDISNQRDIDLLFDKTKSLCGIHRGHGYAHNIYANAFQRFDLSDRRGNAGGTGVGHGLNGNRRAVTHRHLADVNAL